MTTFERLFVWTGGALFVASLAAVAWWFTWPLGAAELGRTGQVSLPALGADAFIFSVFAFHHSLFARGRVKTALASVVPDRLQRSVFVWIASLLLIGVTVAWRPIGGVIYLAPEWIAAALLSVQLAGAWLIVESVRAIDAELAAPPRQRYKRVAVWTLRPRATSPLPGWIIVFGAAHDGRPLAYRDFAVSRRRDSVGRAVTEFRAVACAVTGIRCPGE
jgi:hypothetical protein